MTADVREEILGSVLLAEFSDPRRALMISQALNPDEFKQLSLDCSRRPRARAAVAKGEVLRYDCHATRLTMPGEEPEGDTRQL